MDSDEERAERPGEDHCTAGTPAERERERERERDFHTGSITQYKL